MKRLVQGVKIQCLLTMKCVHREVEVDDVLGFDNDECLAQLIKLLPDLSRLLFVYTDL